MPDAYPPPRDEQESPLPDDGRAGFERLAARLRSIASRAASAEWPGWTERDTGAIAAAALQIEEIPGALAEGMRAAFDLGREYGQGEEELGRLNLEIHSLSSDLARRAWGRGSRDTRGDGRAPPADDA